ncbi:MAG TPA: hypothetical protein VNO26_12685, partial [Candidatus Limnocylindria bacterium]|nr:hypothetical protein [Candidatus Limnocylindria bacterium]
MRLPGRPLLALSTGLLLAPASGHAWLALLPDTPDNGRPFAIAADGAGDVLAAGRVLDPNGDDDGVLAKLAGADGALRWQQRFDGTAPPGSGGENLAAETLRALALAPEGDALAAGMTVNTGSGVDMLVVRRAAADGAVVWDLAVDGGASLRDEAQAIALHDGDVFVAG